MSLTIADIRIHPYRIPFRQPFDTAHGTLAAREGAIVELVTDDGIVGVGDMAAVTEFGAPDVATLVAAAQEYAPLVVDHEPQQAYFNVALGTQLKPKTFITAPQPFCFALETALLDIIQRTAQIQSGISSAPSPVLVNATVGTAATDQAVELACVAVSAGFRCIKLKVGMVGDAGAEVARIHAVRAAIGPTVALRLDANEAWTLQQATAIVNALANEDIQFLEQPLMRTKLAGMRTLRNRTSIAIAADESITDFTSIQTVIRHHAADALILKPQLLGGLFAMPSIRHLVRKANMRAVITTSLESGIGVAATIALAHAHTKDEENALECGLATLPLLEDDLIIEDLPIQDGYISLPLSGRVTLDRAALERYRLEVPGI